MDSAKELILYFLDETERIQKEINKIKRFDYQYEISAILKGKGAVIIKRDELDKLWGFFLVSVTYKSNDMIFKVCFGDKDYELFYIIDIISSGVRTSHGLGNYLTSLGHEPVSDKMGLRNIDFMSRELNKFKGGIKAIII